MIVCVVWHRGGVCLRLVWEIRHFSKNISRVTIFVLKAPDGWKMTLGDEIGPQAGA